MKLAEPLTVWRLVSARHVDQALDGEGARLHGGRWNHPGIPLVYASATLSLATLELFVHLDPEVFPDDLVAVSVRLPAGVEVERLGPSDLPESWRDYPGPQALKDLGSEWQQAGRSPALEVPSAVIPRESNFLINPAHRDVRRFQAGDPEPFSFDPRLRKRG